MNMQSGIIRNLKYKLREPMTTEELYNYLSQRWTAQLPDGGGFTLKKGLFGQFIRFDTYLTIQPRIKVKNDVVKITHLRVQAKVGGIDVKAARQAINVIKDGGRLMDAAIGGPEYFFKVCAEVEKILQDKIVS